MIVLDLSILNQKGTPMFNSDTFANRPTFGIVGRIFISTDTKEFFRDTGTSWELIGGPGSGTITGSGAATQVAFWNSASTITGSNNLFWDSTNNYLGVNTNAPGNPLDVHGNLSSVAALNQTTATNNTLLSLLNSGTPLWRIGNFYTAGANDFGIFDVVNTLQQLTIVKATGQTFIGAKTTASGRLVVNSATADNHLQIVGANAPSIRIDNAGSGGTQRFVFGLATATNNFIQGATAGEFCISTQSAGNMLFGMWQTTNASEVMRITTANNLLIGTSVDSGQKLIVNGTCRINGQVNIFDTTQSSSSSTGCLILDGGLGLAKNIFSNGNIISNGGTLAALNGGSIEVYNSGSSNYFDLKSSGGNFALRTNVGVGAVNALTIASTGDATFSSTIQATGVNIGTASPIGTLSSINTGVANTPSNSAIWLSSSATATADGLGIGSSALLGYKWIQSYDGALVLNPAGNNVLIGTTTNSGERLVVSGTMKVTGAATFSSSIEIGNSVAAAVAAPSTHKVAILIGGVQYYLLASNV